MNAHARGFVDTLIRVVVIQIAVAVAVVSVVVVALGRSEASSSQRAAEQAAPWEPGLSKRFPGCVASVLWPAEEAPRSVLVASPKGEVRLVNVSATSGGLVPSHWKPGLSVIGICR